MENPHAHLRELQKEFAQGWHISITVFNIQKKCPQEVISGKDEGIYQWISINYVLGKLDPERKADSDPGPRLHLIPQS